MQPKKSILRIATLALSAMLLAALSVTALAQSEGAAQSEDDQVDNVSAIMGKQIFRSFCASCHGTEARGDGSVAEYLKVKPADLTQISQRNDGEFPSEKVHQTIDGRTKSRGHGSRDMPIWGDAFKLTRDNPDEEAVTKKIDDLVHYLQSIQEQ